ncbi:MAG: YigZ family protein [Bacteroidetes bacterium]|nr:YigZ family protein [Bacteroidota bacterium]
MEEIFKFKTIKRKSEGLYKEKGSKFIAIAHPVKSEDEFKEVYADVKKEYHNARHHCYAYRVNPEEEEVRSNDDGEPSGTAGKPILNQLYSHELYNICVIVVRYFGGTKLGVSGLINAYKQATIDAIGQANIKTENLKRYLVVGFKYPLMNEVMRVIKEENLKIMDQKFELDCMINLEIKKSIFNKVVIRFENLRGITLSELKNS